MSLADGFIESGNGKSRNYWKIPKEYDAKAGMLYCKSLEKNVRTLAGRVVSVEKVDGDYQGEPTYQLKITLDAQNSQNIFQCSRYSFVGRDILSRLANVDSIAYMAITPYVSEADNGQSYVRCSLKVSSSLEDLMDDNSKIKPIDKALIPTVKEVKVGNKKVLDSEARDKFFDDIVNNIKGKILPMPKYVSVAEPSTADEAPF